MKIENLTVLTFNTNRLKIAVTIKQNFLDAFFKEKKILNENLLYYLFDKPTKIFLSSNTNLNISPCQVLICFQSKSKNACSFRSGC